MNILDLVIPTIVVITPMFVGTLKGYLANKMARIIADFVTPTISAISMTYLLDILLVNTTVVAELASASDIWYVCILVIFAISSWYGFFRLVGFGSEISYMEYAGIQSDRKSSLKLASQILYPMLRSFEKNIERHTEQIIQKNNDEVLVMMSEQQDITFDTIQNITNCAYLIEALDIKISDLSDSQSEYHSLIEKVAQYFANIPQLYEILLSRIDAIKLQQKHADKQPDTDAPSFDTVLTSHDGMANRIIGHQQQDDMAEVLRSAGFGVAVGHGAGMPDYIIKDRDAGTIIAAGSNKSFTLHDEPKRMQRRVSSKDCQPELILAKKIGVPMVLFITNRRNGRRWMSIVKSSNLEEWKGESTPVMLAKDDDDSGQILEEEFCSNIVNLGGNA